MNQVVSWTKEGEIGVITVNNPPVNALSVTVRSGLKDGIEALSADLQVKAIVLICQGRTFIAGADIKEFGKPPKGIDLFAVHETMEFCSKPIVAAIHGTALGGGLETALACHYRVAVPSAKLGLPEIKLGLIPGAGGTQRLPRLIGVEKALDMIVSGDPIQAGEAKQLGIINELIEGDLSKGAISYAKTLVAQGAKPRRVRDLSVDKMPADFFADYRRTKPRLFRGFLAPDCCIRAVEAAANLPFEKGMKIERECFTRLKASTESKAQIYYFFAEREVAKIPDLSADTPKRQISKVGVLGAGTMGSGIAMNFANVGIPVTIVEASKEALDRGIGIIRRNYESSATKGRITQDDVEKRMALLTPSLDYSDLNVVDLVIEAVFENMAIKKEVFQKLDDICKPGCILATNTSTLDVNEIAAVTCRPQDVIGLHFFSPANIMKLLEIPRGDKTGKDVLATCMSMAKTIHKIGVVAGVCHGFIGNRMLGKYTGEANTLLLEGATPVQVDQVLYDFGMPMGPFQMHDLTGLDVGARIRAERRKMGFPDIPNYTMVADLLVEKGWYGQKTGLGFYKYDEKRNRTSDPEVETIIAAEGRRLGYEQRQISDEEIIERCIYPAINEGALILEEGIAMRPVDIDVIWVNGYGFPVYRGGPMFYADTVGVDKVHETIEKYREKYGERVWPRSRLLEKLAKAGKGFAKWKEI